MCLCFLCVPVLMFEVTILIFASMASRWLKTRSGDWLRLRFCLHLRQEGLLLDVERVDFGAQHSQLTVERGVHIFCGGVSAKDRIWVEGAIRIQRFG